MRKVAMLLFFPAILAGQSVTMQWDAVSPTPEGYRVYRTEESGTYSQPLAGPLLATAYSDATAQPGRTYFYTVTSFAGNAESVKSNEIFATIPAALLVAITQPPSVISSSGMPVNVQVESLNANQIELWIGATRVAAGNGSVLVYRWKANKKGTYTLRAVASGALGAMATSSRAIVVQ